MVKAWWKLRDEMGDTLVSSMIDDANNRRIYTTRDSQTGEIKVWGLNFDNDSDTNINLALLGINAADTATLSVLGGTGTKLWTTSADWTSQTLNNFDAGNFNLSIPSASIVLLEVMPVPEPAAMGLIGIGVLAMRRQRTD
jgi:alpha-L-arabinofuranosidase